MFIKNFIYKIKKIIYNKFYLYLLISNKLKIKY